MCKGVCVSVCKGVCMRMSVCVRVCVYGNTCYCIHKPNKSSSFPDFLHICVALKLYNHRPKLIRHEDMKKICTLRFIYNLLWKYLFQLPCAEGDKQYWTIRQMERDNTRGKADRPVDQDFLQSVLKPSRMRITSNEESERAGWGKME